MHASVFWGVFYFTYSVTLLNLRQQREKNSLHLLVCMYKKQLFYFCGEEFPSIQQAKRINARLKASKNYVQSPSGYTIPISFLFRKPDWQKSCHFRSSN